MPNMPQLKFSAKILTLACAAMLAVSGLTLERARAQTRAPQDRSSVAADQQKQVDRLQQLSEQLQKDRDDVHSAVAQHGWDSDEADAAQQRLFKDRQEYRTLRRSLQAAGVSIPADAGGQGMGNQNNPNGHCRAHGHRHNGCCADNRSGHDGDCCCNGHGM
jgi:hypothetical protein